MSIRSGCTCSNPAARGSAREPRAVTRDGAAAAWLVADLALLVCSLSIVKQLGGDYGAIQLVFCRALIGLAVTLPTLRHDWRLLLRTKRP